jgi:RHS repeat-associated protein
MCWCNALRLPANKDSPAVNCTCGRAPPEFWNNETQKENRQESRPDPYSARTVTQGFGSAQNPRQKYGLTERDDATGLDHTWFRKHENRAGRWTGPDPYGGSMSIGDPQSFNRYSYVQSQPTNFVDPSGLKLRYYDVWMERTCVKTDGVWHCTEFINRYWFDDGFDFGHNGGGFLNDDREILGLGLIGFLARVGVEGKCADALKALNLTSKEIFDAFDRAKFIPDQSRPKGHAKSQLFVGGKIRTLNGIDDFIASPTMSWLLHELAHQASKLDDGPMYNAIKDAGIDIPLVTSTKVVKGKTITTNEYSKTLSDFFNTHCK